MLDDNITLREIYGGEKEWYKKRKILIENKDPLTYKLIGLAMEVYNNIGSGFLEDVYQEAYEIELLQNRIDYVKEKNWKYSIKERNLIHFTKQILFA